MEEFLLAVAKGFRIILIAFGYLLLVPVFAVGVFLGILCMAGLLAAA